MKHMQIKEKKSGKLNKKSQVTIFIIISIVIIAVLAILLYPRLKIIGVSPETTEEYIEACAEKAIGEAKEKLSMQGGSLEPESYVMFSGNKVEYLCYTNEYYQKCVMQRPILKRHFEQEIEQYAKEKIDGCVSKFKSEIENKGYSADIAPVDVNVEIIPESIEVDIDTSITLTKGSSQTYSDFSASSKSEMYNLLTISSSILNWEARYGDSDPVAYMAYYPDLKVEKLKQTDGTTIYTLTHRGTKEKFVFASRSIPWPAGYGVKEVLL